MLASSFSVALAAALALPRAVAEVFFVVSS